MTKTVAAARLAQTRHEASLYWQRSIATVLIDYILMAFSHYSTVPPVWYRCSAGTKHNIAATVTSEQCPRDCLAATVSARAARPLQISNHDCLRRRPRRYNLWPSEFQFLISVRFWRSSGVCDMVTAHRTCAVPHSTVNQSRAAVARQHHRTEFISTSSPLEATVFT